MGIFLSKSYNKNKFKNRIFSVIFIISIFIISISANSNYFSNSERNETFIEHNDDLKISNPYLFQGSEPALNITDEANLYKLNQEISLSNEEELNLSYYLDDEHDWEILEIQNGITNIEDTRNWVNNSGIQPVTVYREYQSFQSDHYPYVQNRGRLDIDNIVFEEGAFYMRVHFSNISFDVQPLVEDTDYIYLYNYSAYEFFVETGFREDFYSPWISGDTIYVTYRSDNSNNNDYGYYIDYYEFVNASSNVYPNEYSWGFKYKQNYNWGANNYGFGEMGNNTAMFIGYYGDYIDPETFDYDIGTFSEAYQDLTIPRGQVIDAYLKFDYYLEFGLETNDNFMYASINNQKAFSRGMADIVNLGKHKWHHTGNIPMNLWVNSSEIFEKTYIKDQQLNISLGIKSGGAWQYSGSEDCNINVIWFDNISLVVTTIANSSQDGIDLTINSINLSEGEEWGKSYLNLTDGWNTNPVILTVNTTSPSLEFELDSILYGSHNSETKINQQNEEGILFKILNNNTIYWEFYHNFYMPAEYSDFEFTVTKPNNWKIISVLDPTFIPIPFEGGNLGEDYIKINSTYAIFPGWWRFKASSPNYISENNTDMSKDGQWGYSEFYSGDSIRVKTQVNSTNEIPLNLDTTVVNFTIYYPNSSIWYQESKIPLSNGTVIFSDILLTSLNSVGGVYNYTLFWSNGTALGGLKSNFTVIHDSYLTILKPDDAKLDNQTGGTVGDIIPLRIYLRDAENDIYISEAIVSYNWTTGTEFLVEASLGIYEAVLDTADLGGFGLYNIIISTSKVGFINSNSTLRINLGEDTNLQRLESDSKIVIDTNSTIRFFYYSEFDEEGISGAQVLVNISNPAYYTVQEESDGYYSIEFSTEFFDNIGVYRLVFEFSAIGYEPQTHIFQFEIINPPVTREKPNYMLLGILFASIGIGAIFAALSLRSYVILPRKRRKESELLAETQRFKDIRNIQAIVIIHKLSGIPIFSKSYSILEKHNKELFSGFIQAITTIGEEFVERESAKPKMKESTKGYGTERIMELDFKYFYCLIADLEEVRTVLVLSEKSSERLRSELRHLLLALNLNLSEQLQSWDGSLDQFEVILPSILNEYFELYYKESFQLNIRDNEFLKMTKDKSLNKMEIRVLNVINSVAKSKENIINLDMIINLVHEENKDIIIKAIESLIAQKIIIPFN